MPIPAEYADYTNLFLPAQDVNGWTIIPAGPDQGGAPGRHCYVSPEGDDGADGLTGDTAFATFERALEHMHGAPFGNNHVYIDSGPASNSQYSYVADHFAHGSVPSSPQAGKVWPGGCIFHPYRIGKPPIIATPDNQPFPFSLRGDPSSGQQLHGLWFMPRTYYEHIINGALWATVNTVPVTCIEIYGARSNVLIEGNRFEGYGSGFQIQSDSGVRPSGITIRRNVFYNMFNSSFALGQGAGGGYANNVDGLLIEENYMMGCGHNDAQNIPGDGLRQNLYIQPTCENVLVQKNVIVDASHSAVQLRGRRQSAHDNTIIRCALGPSGGHALSANNWPQNAWRGKIKYNIIMDARDIRPGGVDPRGRGITATLCIGAEVAYNLIINNRTGTGSTGNEYAFGSHDDTQGTAVPPSASRVLEYTCHVHHNRIHGWQGGGSASGLNFNYTVGTGAPYKLSPNFVVENNVLSDVPVSLVVGRTDQGATIRDNALARDSTLVKTQAGATVDIAASNAALGNQPADNNAETGPFTSDTFTQTTIGTYLASIGFSAPNQTYLGYIAQAKLQRKGAWVATLTSAAINAWARARFTLAEPNVNNQTGVPTGENVPTDTGGPQRRIVICISVALD